MSIVRCDRCERPADLDLEDMVEIIGGTGFVHSDCLPISEPISLAPATCADFEEANEKKEE